MSLSAACRATRQRISPCFQVSKLRFSVTSLSCADRLTFAKPFSDVPKIPALPIVGSSWIYFPILGRYNIRKLNEAAWDMYQRYGPVVGERLPGRRIVVHLFSADDIRTLYQEEGRTPYRMGALPFKLYHTERKEYFANAGILNAQGEEWRQIRTAVQPCTIRPRTVQLYAEGLGQIADDAVDLIASDRDENGDVPDCYTIMQRWALESVMLVSMDQRLGLLDNPLSPDSDAAGILNGIVALFSDMDKLVTRFPYYRYFPTPIIRRFQRTGDYLVARMSHIIKEAAEATKSRGNNNENCTILQHLYNQQKTEFKEIFTFLHDFVIGGTDTTSGAATFTLYRLAVNPAAQEKARQEVLAATKKCAGTLSADSHQHLSYVKACIKEALRFHPIIPGVNRKINHDLVLSGYRIPANTVLRTEPFVAGRLEENFTRASEFLPERWLRSSDDHSSKTNDDTWNLHPFASLPFSIGPRMCIGRRIAEMELCILVAKVLQRYRVENHHGDIGFLTQFTGKPAKPAKFRFVELNTTT
ncbi:probable cytochrome P450 301a1, mitochondrial [Dermacentor albipictus]|uniref:probable cytochrome P450 301a1, mitochondrial n=1 Tax=Dermacentor albipictus TaxID=60249 RepID=UPI0031FC57C8